MSASTTHAEIYSVVTKYESIQAYIAVDPSGNIYAASYDHIKKFDSDGNFITQWGSSGKNSGQFDGINGIATDSSNNIYVVDSGNNRVEKFDSNGVYITQWGSEGTENGNFSNPRGVAVDSSGNIIVGDYNNYRIQKFSNTGEYIDQWNAIEDSEQLEIFNIAVDPEDNIYIVNPYGIEKFDNTGTFVTKIASGDAIEEVKEPVSIAVDSKGYVYTSSQGDYIKMFDSDGNFVAQWGSHGYDDGQFFGIYNVAVDSSDYVYVTDVTRGQKLSINRDELPTIPISSPPVANFNSNATEGNAPFTVQFTDDSQNAQVLLWSFGDGDTSNAQNPIHKYKKAGTYNIELIASNVKGENSKMGTIFVNEAGSDSANRQSSEVSNTPEDVDQTPEQTDTSNTNQNSSKKSPGFGVALGILTMLGVFLYNKK